MKTILFIILSIIVSGCSKVDLLQYSDNKPKLSLFEYFEGNTKGWGIVQNRKGDLTRQFVVDIFGSIENNTITLTENFNWSDGEESSRIWTIVRTNERQYTGTAGDVVGTATGSISGNVFSWQYFLNITENGSTWKVHLDDWMYLQPDNILINRTKISKFGIHLGDVTITFQKL